MRSMQFVPVALSRGPVRARLSNFCPLGAEPGTLFTSGGRGADGSERADLAKVGITATPRGLATRDLLNADMAEDSARSPRARAN